jgi:hypothetical protein
MKFTSTPARMLTIAGVGIGAVALVGGTATAASMITASQMGTGSVNSRVVQDGSIHQVDLTQAERDMLHSAKNDTLRGAVYRVENYTNGGGGSATVACADDDATSQKFTAIAGGVQGSTVAHQAADSFAVTSSFPGRMDWDAGEPKAGRLDGWIVLGNSQYTGTLKVWALCVPTTSIPVQQVDIDN